MLLALAILPARARAQDPDAEIRTTARDLASQGVEAFEQHDFTTALDRFDRAFALVPAPSISILQARSLVQLGRYLEALDRYEKTQRMPLPGDAPEAFKQAVSDAQSESRALWARVPRLTIHVQTPAAAPSDMNIFLDSKRVPAALLDVSRPADPGPHTVSVKATGFETETRAISLEPGGQITLDIPLRAGSTAAPAQSSPAAYLDNLEAPRSTTTRTLAWTAVGVGTAGLALSAVTGVIALGKHSTLDSQCHPGCPPSAANDLSTFRTTRDMSYVSLLAGSLSLGIGGYFLLTGSGGSNSLGAAVGPTRLGIWGTF